MPRLHPTTILLFPLRVLTIPFTTLIARIPILRSRHRRTRTLTMLLPLLVLLLILLTLLPLYIIYRPPHALIRSLANKYPDTLWEIPLPTTKDTEGKGTEKVIALTIDDAPSTYTLDILHLLQQHDARATFFLIGSQIPGREGILHTLVKSGMELGNHAMHDEPSVSIGEEVLEREMLEVDGVIDRVYEESGVKRPRYEDGAVKKWFRPGSGFFNGWMRGLVQRLGYKIVLGSVYPHDAQIGWAGVNAWHVRSMVREGSIVVMHDRRSWTVEGLRRVLPVLKERGYRVVSLGEAMEIANAASTDGGKEID
ncbi:CAZyme family CE4 [Aspergillus niger]|nr:CAZyme family CE4 [Aspergillus niger]KAI2906104.1 CAZyme family CE4 [Aspergillus niger]KAI2918701.1 CAZyme family CE4 [Aspergillus niger]KAI2934734.1 CAZyme family CE4 [Aspergillus niger]KAI2973036.1 CAZyme family CE4 [Aspergillus niger]